jgi:hypothetical protein
MAYFAKLGDNNKVITVHVVSNKVLLDENGQESEQKGIDFLNTLHKTNDVWVQTSYNTLGGVHQLDGTPFRKNYAGIGFTYDETKDAFIPPKPYPSWILNEDTCHWEAPIPKPDYATKWNEETTSWAEEEVERTKS